MAKRETVPVIFRAQREDGQLWITAVFPSLAGTYDPSTFTVYQHVGQHGSGTLGWYRRTRPATEAEYAPLLAELRGIYETSYGTGDEAYTLRVVKRFSPAHDAERKRQTSRQVVAGG